MRKFIHILVLFVFVIACVPSQPRRSIVTPKTTQSSDKLPKNEDSKTQISEESIPQPTTYKTQYFIEYTGYSVSYNEDMRIPNWVLYELTAEETDGPYSRKRKEFRQDPSLNVRQADSEDYRNSGWSRGHMAPAGDFKWSDKAMWDTFYYTNCCPQNQSLNGGQWHSLEQKVRAWANWYGSVIVYTGPLVFENTYGTIGHNKVVVPDAFFKAVLAGEQSIAFVMYNKPDNENMQKCAMSVDDLEELSGIDFFPELDDEFEEKVEATYNLKYWGL